MATYRVLRQHEGDRFYREGDLREIDPAEAAHLERLKVLEKVEEAASNKVEPKPQNKAEAKLRAKGAKAPEDN